MNLAWTASNDDVGVSAYQILRDGTQIGTTSATSYTDTTVQPVTTYSYTVIAADSSNNVSAASNTATVTTPPLETTLTITPTDDSYDAQDLPTSNFGSATRVITDGSPVRHTLLKFVVSGVNGRTVTSATLRLSCADPSPAGGEFHAVTTNSWTEGTVTWNTEPALNPTVLATLGKVSVGTTYQVGLSSLIKGDGTYSIGIITANTDSAQYSSKEDAAGTPPQLVVTTGGTPDTTAPTAPTGLTATAVSAGRIDLAWTGSTDNVGVTGYKIFRDGAQIATSPSTSYSDRTALPSTTYTYTVQAYDAAGEHVAGVGSGRRHDAGRYNRAHRADERHGGGGRPDAGERLLDCLDRRRRRQLVRGATQQRSGRNDGIDLVRRHDCGSGDDVHVHRRGARRGR